jgi:hypothetical protein
MLSGWQLSPADRTEKWLLEAYESSMKIIDSFKNNVVIAHNKLKNLCN